MTMLRIQVLPKNPNRTKLIELTIMLTKQNPSLVIDGDVLDVFPDVLPELPDYSTICLFHSHTLYQFPQELRNRLSSQIAELSRGRNLFEISFDWWRGKEQPLLELGRIRNGNREEEVLAYCNPHGEWLQWVHKGQL